MFFFRLRGRFVYRLNDLLEIAAVLEQFHSHGRIIDFDTS